MKKKKGMFLLPLLVLCAALVHAPPAKAGGPSEITMRVGEEQKIYAPITTMSTNNGYWTSNSPSVAVRSYTGYCCTVAAKSVTGSMTAVLTHHYEEKSGNYTYTRTQDVRVTVLPPLPGSVSLSPRSLTLAPGEGYQLTPSVSPADADYGAYLYSSEDLNVASVDSNGYVRGVSSGTTRIKVRTRNEAKTAYCDVVVATDPPKGAVSLLGWTAGDASAVILSDPDGALGNCGAVFAASFDGGRMQSLLPGKLLGTTVTVNGRLELGWKLFFLDGETFSPVCSAVTLTE